MFSVYLKGLLKRFNLYGIEVDYMKIVTKEWIMKNRTKGGSWTKPQIEALGVTWPPRKKWIKQLEGSNISDEKAAVFEKKETIKNSRAKKARFNYGMS